MMYSLRSIDQRIMKLGMADTVRNSFIALPVISIFELIMILRWFMIANLPPSTGSMMYLIGYITLLIVTVATLAVIRSPQKDLDRHYRRVYLIQSLYSVIIVAWTIWITYTSSHYYHRFDYLVYVTIVIIVPVFCFLSPLHWVPVQLVSAGIILCIAYTHDNFDSFVINFSVFTIISIIASWSLYSVRFSGYQRQIELEEERDQSSYHACHDALTSLPNRRSYIADLEKIEKNGRMDRLYLAMFDVNGLKQVNDTLGHDAGDELLIGAADCLRQAFSAYGTIYRVGGDEFTGIFYADSADISAALQRFHEREAAWKGCGTHKLSVSMGIAASADHPDTSLKDLETIADDTMYAAKRSHYQEIRASR